MADAWDPQQYAKFQSERSKPFYDLLEGLTKRLVESGIVAPRVLDLGCGSGDLTKILHEESGAYETVGVELSPAMLEQARKLSAPESGVLRFEAGDLATYGDSAPYDVVFANASLQWTLDHPKRLVGFRSLLKDGGWLAIQVPSNHEYPTHRLADALAEEPRWKGRDLGSHLGRAVLTPEAYTETLWRAGYRDPSVRLEVYAHVFPNRTFVLEWVKGTMLTRARAALSPEEYAEFLGEYEKRLFAVLPDDRPFLYPFQRILFWARKT